MQEDDPYRREPNAARTDLSTSGERERKPAGLGGWLIVLGFLMVWSLIAGAWLAVTSFGLLDAAGLSPAKHTALMFHTAANSVLSAFNLAALALFFLKSQMFVRALIAWLVVDAIATFVALWLSVRADPSGEGVPVAMSLVRVAVWNGGWAAYALLSKRVKNTFVQPRP
ncbi:DUF2569 family protein [Lysobacter sp. K5869]|uniref:DUF2569 family protein n=1 Tax=Lysobacter sp. K5869 TaxID=2820808 RepID=UPI001C05EDC6|nr:DUF2569 family protein [Lysobacter sp. K5869]QWP77626.1 DUF2569 family protein [Lysobacter sp. K5869]